MFLPFLNHYVAYIFLQSELTNVEKKIDHMDWKREMMSQKISDMDSYMTVIDKVMCKTDKEIKQLE